MALFLGQWKYPVGFIIMDLYHYTFIQTQNVHHPREPQDKLWILDDYDVSL